MLPQVDVAGVHQGFRLLYHGDACIVLGKEPVAHRLGGEDRGAQQVAGLRRCHGRPHELEHYARTLKIANPDDVLFVLVSYLPVPGKLGEMKTKPTQYAVRTMNSYGVAPDIIIARGEVPLDEKRKEKIAASSGMKVEQEIAAPDVDSIYDVPINFEKDTTVASNLVEASTSRNILEEVDNLDLLIECKNILPYL